MESKYDIDLEQLAEQYPDVARLRRRQTSPDICRKTRASSTRQDKTP
jgi:hypothetical protein